MQQKKCLTNAPGFPKKDLDIVKTPYGDVDLADVHADFRRAVLLGIRTDDEAFWDITTENGRNAQVIEQRIVEGARVGQQH